MLMCRHCGWDNPDEAAFCTNCGRGLARGRGAEVSDKPSQRFRALGSPVVKVQGSEPPEPATPPMPRLSPPPSTTSAPTLLDFRMPEQMLAELARAREAKARESSAPPPAAVPEAATELASGPAVEPIETLEPDALEPPDSHPPRSESDLPVTLQEVPTLRASRPVELGAIARAIRAEVEEPPEPEALVVSDPVNLPTDLPLLPVLDDDEAEEAEERPAELDDRPTMRLGSAADLSALLGPPTPGRSEGETRITQEDLPFSVPDESGDLMPDHMVEVDDSLSGLVEPDAFTGVIEGSDPIGVVSSSEGDDLLEDVEDLIEEVDEEGPDMLASDELEALHIESLARVAPPPLPPNSVRFLLRPLSENLDPLLLVPIAAEPVLIGRHEGELLLKNDAYVSPRHARLVMEGDELFIEDLESLNGVWLRIRGDAPLRAGAHFLAGEHVFRLDQLSLNGVDATGEDGTRRLGAGSRHTPFQLTVLAGDGVITHVHRLPPEGCRLGRHVADLVFTDDAFMSGTHALLRPRDEAVLLRDLASRNGTWLRIQGRTRLEAGDAVMIGRSVLRIGAPAA